MSEPMNYHDFYEVVREKLPAVAAREHYNVKFYDLIEEMRTNHVAFFFPTDENADKRVYRNYVTNMHSDYIDHDSVDKALLATISEIKNDKKSTSPFAGAVADEICGLVKGITSQYVLNNTVISLHSKELTPEYIAPHNLYREYLDMCITYDVRLNADRPNNEIAIRLSEDLAKECGINESDFYEKAVENSVRLRPAEIKSQASLIDEAEGVPPHVKAIAMEQALLHKKYSISNPYGYEGAAVILYPGILEQVSVIMGGSYYLLPVSRTEFYAAPIDKANNIGELKEAVAISAEREEKDLNALTKSLYLYNKEDKKVRIL